VKGLQDTLRPSLLVLYSPESRILKCAQSDGLRGANAFEHV